MVDTRAPQTYLHLHLKLKKLQVRNSEHGVFLHPADMPYKNNTSAAGSECWKLKNMSPYVVITSMFIIDLALLCIRVY